MGSYYFAKEGKKYFFKLTGTLKYTTCGHFDTFLDNFLNTKQEIEQAAIDLTEADYIDSTNLGFIAKIAEYMLEKYGKKTIIYSVSENINQTLCGLGFDEIFTLIKSKSDMDEKFGKIDPEKFCKKDMTVMMIDAHKCLMKINDKNAEIFKDVVSLMEQSLNKN